MKRNDMARCCRPFGTITGGLMFAGGNAANWGAISTDGADPGVQAFGRPSA